MIVGVPWRTSDKDSKADGEQLEVMKFSDEQVAAERELVRESVPRRFRINKDGLQDHGFTARCHGCRAALSGARPQGHSEDCQARMEKALEGAEKIKAAGEKFHELLAKAVEKNDVNRKRQAQSRDRSVASGSGMLPEERKRSREEETEDVDAEGSAGVRSRVEEAAHSEDTRNIKFDDFS